MKNHIAIKFIAILLCTLTLLGCISSAAGLLIMTEADLYNKTVDQVREDLIWSNGEYFAREASLNYASQTLGGCSEAMVTQHFGSYWVQDFFRPGAYSYSILDPEGNELYRQGDPIRGGTSYTFPVTGQYLHLVSSETESDKNLREAQERTQFYDMEPVTTLNGVDIPADGIEVTYASFVSQTGELLMEAYFDGGETVVSFFNAQGGQTSFHEGNKIGFLMLNQDSHLVFRSNHVYPDMMLNNTSILEANFFVPGDVNLKLRDDINGVGYLYCDSLGTVCFTSLTSAIPEETEPEIPDVQAPDALNIPAIPSLVEIQSTIESEITHITLAAFYGPDGSKLLNLYHPDGIGTLFCSRDGQLAFLIDNDHHQDAYLQTLADTTIGGVFFQDPTGEFTYRAACADGVGSIDENASHLIWTSKANVSVPAEGPEDLEAETTPEDAEAGEADTSAEDTGAAESEESDTKDASASEETTPPTEEDSAEEETKPAEEASEKAKAKSEEDPTEETAAADAAEAQTEPTAAPTEATVPPTVVIEATVPATEAPMETIEFTASFTAPVLINGKPLEEYQVETDAYWDDALGQTVYARYVRLPMPEYTVVLQIAPNALKYEDAYTLLTLLRNNRKILLPSLAVCLLLFAICVVYLCTAAGKKPKSQEIRAGGLNRLPLDLYFALAFFGIVLAANIGIESIRFRLGENVLGICILAVSMAFLACLILVAFCFAAVAQVKTPDGFWYHNTLCGQSIRVLLRFTAWLKIVMAETVIPTSWKWIKTVSITCWRLWNLTANFLISIFGRFFTWIGRTLHRFLSLLPITWQWLLAGCVIIFLAALTLNSYNGFVVSFGLLAIIAIILYGAHCFGILSESARKMSKGDLKTKVEDKLLLGCFKEFAGDLNDLADVAVVAAQNQLRSERMKTELITNVSHDIKTPLTSIINYVDLLQKAHTPEEQEQYLEVLDRQSQRLKKLIDDLMDMSKASTGNMSVEVTTVDAVESVNQALGEFSDKLAAAHLIPVFRHGEARIPMTADGKLVWRVLSNLLSNAVKYAMPGTRLYIDLMELEGKVILSLKNISREELNLDAEELMERFVRGDDSRNTEGSGLGLNIAKSLMELQKGELQLLVDGDLFKVTLIFPGK